MDLGGLFAATVFWTLLSLRPAKLLISAALLFVIVSAATSPRLVRDQAGLFEAFGSQDVTHIQLANSITISAIKGPGSWPLLLGRNCLVEATPGSSYPRLDFNFAASDRVKLGPGVTLTFRGLLLVNTFSASQLALDFFAPSPASSSIVWEGVVDRRSICQPLPAIRNAWTNAPRPADGGSSSQQQQQQVIVDGPNCNGDQGCFSMPVLRSYDVLVDSPAGYRLRLNNTLTVCDEFISEACIQNLGSDLCYLNRIEELMSKLQDSGPQPSSGSSGGLSSGAKAGIIAGCVVGGVAVLLLLLGALLLRRHHRQRNRRSLALFSSGAGGGVTAFSALDPTSEVGLAALGSTRSGDTAPSNTTPHQQQHQQQHQQHVNVTKLLPGIKADGRPSQDTTNSTDVRPSPGPAAAALESVGSGGSYRIGSALSGGGGGGGGGGGLPLSGWDTRDAPRSSTTTTTTNQRQSQQQLQGGGGGSSQGHAASGGGGGGSTHSLGSAMMAMLRSVLTRGGSQLEQVERPPPPPAAPAAVAAPAALASASGSAAGGSAPAMATGSGAGRVAAAAVGSAAAGAGMPRRVPSVKSGVLSSARGSSGRGSSAGGGQVVVASGAGKPSIGEIQHELERMEEQWTREQSKPGGSKRSTSFSSASRARSPSVGPVGAAAGTAGTAGGGGGGGGGGPSEQQQQRHPIGKQQQHPAPAKSMPPR